MNALIFFASFFVVLAIACSIADGFHRLSEARLSSRSTAQVNATIPPDGRRLASCPPAVPSGGFSGVPENGDKGLPSTVPAHRFERWVGTTDKNPFEYPDPDRDGSLWLAQCTCGVRMWNLPSYESCIDWMKLHSSIERDLETWASGRPFDWRAEA